MAIFHDSAWSMGAKGFGRIRPSSPRRCLALPNSLEYLELVPLYDLVLPYWYLSTNLFRALAFHFKLLTAAGSFLLSAERFFSNLETSSIGKVQQFNVNVERQIPAMLCSQLARGFTRQPRSGGWQ